MAWGKDEEVKKEIIKDFGSFGEGKWQYHLALVKWGDNPPKYDVRPWNEDMTKCGKGITLDSTDMFDLMSLLETALDSLSAGSDGKITRQGDESEDVMSEDGE